MSPTKTVFAINGDAGTGKTFIALASIGQILNFMAENEDSLLHAVSSPKLVCLNNSAADLISKTCRSPLAKSKNSILMPTLFSAANNSTPTHSIF